MEMDSEFSTAFSVVSKQFPEEGEKIRTSHLLEASKELVAMIEKFGRVFSPVVYDMTQNIQESNRHTLQKAMSLFFDGIIREFDQNISSDDLTQLIKKVYNETLEPHHGWLGTQLFNKLSKKYEKDVKAHEYIEDMILLQKPEDRINATDALLWLSRALNFLSLFFDGIIREFDQNISSDDLTQLIKKVYNETLEPHHGWLGTQLFNILSKFAPTRDNLLHKLALENPDRQQQVIMDMREYNRKMSHCVHVLTDFYADNNLPV